MNYDKTEKQQSAPVRDHCRDRSWLEINLTNLIHNTQVLQQIMPKGCEMMAIVKANAYGHGADKIAHCLNTIGIKAFGVATADEGIALRKRGIHGEILILGYTDVARVEELIHYRLTQTVIDYDYALKLEECGRPLPVHIKIDTGMHRIGIPAEDTDNINQLFRFHNLRIRGIYTHLSVADSIKPDDVLYTNSQLKAFSALLKELSARSVKLPKLHIQSSYGLLNYPELHCDYARIGIALYGTSSYPNDHTRLHPDLLPVLSMKARVALIREVEEGEPVSYGRTFTAKRRSRVALLPVGYADGLPRSLSCEAGSVLLHGCIAPIIGRICMDQLLVDVTDIPEVKPGDIATLIGRDGSREITAAEVAARSGSITNELFSRLGDRLDRVYIYNTPFSLLTPRLDTVPAYL